MAPPVIQRLIDIIENDRADQVDGLLADDAVFYSPAVFTAQEGRDKTAVQAVMPRMAELLQAP